MICSRCGKKTNTDKQERNAEIYGSCLVACPYCGQAHSFQSVTKIQITPVQSCAEEDDWGRVIISDEEYEKIKCLKR